MQDINRLKLVLVEQKKGGGLDIDNIVEGYPSKWLSEEFKSFHRFQMVYKFLTARH